MRSPISGGSERDAAVKICADLHHAYREFRLYPSTHPMVRTAIERLLQSVTSYADRYGPLELRVEENRLLHGDAEVYAFDLSRDNPAFLMFRDGIRSLAMRPGITTREIEALVDCLANADDLADFEHDLATALWERELHHIDYHVVDPFLMGGGEERDEAVDDLRRTVARRLDELAAATAAGTGGAGTGEGGEDASGTSSDGEAQEDEADRGVTADTVSLSPEETDAIERLVEESAAVLDDFVVVLLEILGAGIETSGDENLVQSLVLAVGQYFDGLNVEGLRLTVARLRDLEAGGRRPRGFGAQVIGAAATADRLAALMESMSGATTEEAAEIEALLRDMGQWVYPGLLRVLAEDVSHKAVRKTALDLLRSGDGVPAEQLWPLLEDPRWYVVRNAVDLTIGLDHPELADRLERLFNHPDARVRREVIRSLDALGGPRATELLVRALSDSDSSVRTLAVAGLGHHGDRSHYLSVLAQVEASDFDRRPQEEIEACLKTLAVMGQGSAVEILDRLWRRRVFRTRSAGVRTAAVEALGSIPSSEARRVLAEAANVGDSIVRKAALRAMSTSDPRFPRLGP